MGLLDFLQKDKKEGKVQVQLVELGAPGTNIISGIITEDYNPDLQGTQAVKKFDEMRKNDAQVKASLLAVKLPLLSARWFIQRAEGDEVDEDLAEEQALFIEENLFNKLKWKKQLKLILTYLDFGYKYLEKVFGIDEETGLIVWRKWGDRQQSAHYKWESDTTPPIVGAKQQLPVVTENLEDAQPFTPLEKLLLFSYDREGDNYEGVSMLRGAYKHWWYKDTLYKIQGIQAERYGVGIPTATMGESNSSDDKNKAEEMCKNVKSNESSYMILPFGWQFDIKTPIGNAQGSSIEAAITHHNRMILMNVLAGFLDLGSGSSGSFALGREQGSFFTLGLQSIADDIKETINDAIKELILMNWTDTKKFPKLDVTDIANIDGESFSNMLNVLAMGNFITPDKDLKKFVRNSLKLPEMTAEEEEIEDNFDPEEVDTKIKPEEIEEELKKKKKLVDKNMTPDREKQFYIDTEKNESIIENDYLLFEREIEKTEVQLKKFLNNKFDGANKKIVSGVIVVKRSIRLINEVKSGINDIMKKFKLRVSGGALSGKIMKDVAKNAIISSTRLKETREFGPSLLIAEPQLKSFMAGHISNMNGVIFNEGRQTFENMQENISQEVSIRLVKKQIDQIKFNRNIYKLSVTAHPRGLFRAIIAEDAKETGINHFKVLVPGATIIAGTNKKVNEGINVSTEALGFTPAKREIQKKGNIALWLFLIITAQQINERSGVKDNVDAVGGLGLNHNSFEYYYPINEDKISEEQKLAKEQRADFNKLVK